MVGASVGVALIPYEDAKPLHWFEGFYRTGSFIFGGGQVRGGLRVCDGVTRDLISAIITYGARHLRQRSSAYMREDEMKDYVVFFATYPRAIL